MEAVWDSPGHTLWVTEQLLDTLTLCPQEDAEETWVCLLQCHFDPICCKVSTLALPLDLCEACLPWDASTASAPSLWA